MMSKKNHKIIIIIPSYNGQKYWPDLMQSLRQQNYDFEWEILVVDNASTDQSVEYLKQNYPEVKVIVNSENLGYVGANNVGYQYAKEQGADFIYLLNQDTVVERNFLQPLYDFALENKFGSLQSKLRLWPDKDKINTMGNAIHYLGFGYGTQSGKVDNFDTEIKKINYASGAGVFVSMEALDILGGLFDETMFMYLEDLDLGWSLTLIDHPNFIIPQSVIYHKYEFSRSMKHLYWFERNRWWVMLKNYKVGTIILFLPALLLMELAQLLFAVLNKRIGARLKVYLQIFNIKNWFILKKKRVKIQRLRKISDRKIVASFSGKILFQPLDSIALKIANIFFYIYLVIIRRFIFW